MQIIKQVIPALGIISLYLIAAPAAHAGFITPEFRCAINDFYPSNNRTEALDIEAAAKICPNFRIEKVTYIDAATNAPKDNYLFVCPWRFGTQENPCATKRIPGTINTIIGTSDSCPNGVSPVAAGTIKICPVPAQTSPVFPLSPPPIQTPATATPVVQPITPSPAITPNPPITQPITPTEVQPPVAVVKILTICPKESLPSFLNIPEFDTLCRSHNGEVKNETSFMQCFANASIACTPYKHNLWCDPSAFGADQPATDESKGTLFEERCAAAHGKVTKKERLWVCSGNSDLITLDICWGYPAVKITTPLKPKPPTLPC